MATIDSKHRQKYCMEVLRLLEVRYGNTPHTALVHKNKTELFVAALLSPQCSDKQVNVVTKALFKKYRGFDDLAESDLKTLGRYLKGLNYYKTKARHLRDSSKMIQYVFRGRIPRTINELTKLPGVGRKVANVVLNEGFRINEGVAIDTHCITVSRRLGITRHKEATEIEKDIMRSYPRKKWGRISNLFIALGRDVCTARFKDCNACILKDICPSSDADPIKDGK